MTTLTTVTAVSRRFVILTDEEGKDYNARLASGDLSCCVGDKVEIKDTKAERQIVNKIHKRKNLLKRQDANKEKLLCANTDLLCIVCAPPPLFNNSVNNRLLSTAHSEDIPAVIVFNKIDLIEKKELAEELLKEHGLNNLKSFFISAKCGTGVENFQEFLINFGGTCIAFAGISGVGKSTLLNALIPDRNVRTQELSEKSQQGKQTTSQALAYRFSSNKKKVSYIIDLPGIQQFGICHLNEQMVRSSFPEFSDLEGVCRFSDCSHQHEPECVVLEAIEKRLIARARYEAYCEMIKEIKNTKKY